MPRTTNTSGMSRAAAFRHALHFLVHHRHCNAGLVPGRIGEEGRGSGPGERRSFGYPCDSGSGLASVTFKFGPAQLDVGSEEH